MDLWIRSQDKNHFLTKYGFKYGERSGPCGETGFTNTYTLTIQNGYGLP